MDFDFTDEQNMLRDSVRKFVQKSYPIDARRALLKSELGFSRDNWKSFAELGWTALPFSEEDGGLGGSAIDTMIILEELAKGLVLEPYLATVVYAGGLLRRAGDAVRKQHLAGIIEGTTIATVAHAEPESRFDLSRVATTAKKDGSGYVLDGRKVAVLAGHAADLVIVPARTSGNVGDKSGITLFVVDGKSSGLSRRGYPTVDGLRVADLTLAGVKVAADQIIGEVDQGFTLLDQATDEAIVALGAEAVGVMEVLYKSTVEYTKERKQFGVPISSFQVLQHRMVDQFMHYEQAKSLLYQATMTQAAGRPLGRAASGLKVQLGRSGRFVGQAAIQNHGGMGMTEELAVSHFFKRISTIDLLFGNSEYHLDRYTALSASA